MEEIFEGRIKICDLLKNELNDPTKPTIFLGSMQIRIYFRPFIKVNEITISGLSKLNIPEEEKAVYRRHAIRIGYKPYILDRIHNGLTEAEELKIIIRTQVVGNVELGKKRSRSHIQNGKNKALGVNSYTKPLYLYDFYSKLNSISKNNIRQLVIDILKHTFVCEQTNDDREAEVYYTYFILCKIYQIIDSYTTYLKNCVNNINDDIFHLNKKYYQQNDIKRKTIVKKQGTDNYDYEYHILDYNTFAINNSTKHKSNASVLSLDNINRIWHLYPDYDNEDDETFSVTELEQKIEYYNENGIDPLDEEISSMTDYARQIKDQN
jgi:hypothetical protein